MADDTVSCFTALLESVPGWITDLENILQIVTDRQKEYLVANQGDESPKFLSKKPSKSSSLKSTHSGDHDKEATPEVATPTDTEAALLAPQLQHFTSTDVLRLAQRKRKTASVCSAGQSAPTKYRSRSMVVVYYDAGVQKQFETLVRGIGTSRNAVRKGKMNAKLNALSRTGSSGSESSDRSDRDDERKFGSGKLAFKSTRTQQARGGMFGREDDTKPFERLDDILEKSQALCERAAHQVLRDGDCAVEIQNAKARLAEAKHVASEELPTIRKKADKAAERQRRDEELCRLEDEEKERSRLDKLERLSHNRPSEKVVALVARVPSDGRLEIDQDDESDDDDGEFNIETLKMGRFGGGMRTSRLAAHGH